MVEKMVISPQNELPTLPWVNPIIVKTPGMLLTEEIFEIETKTRVYPSEYPTFIEYSEKIIYKLDWNNICKHTPERGCKNCTHFVQSGKLISSYGRRHYIDWCWKHEYQPGLYPVPCEDFQCHICNDQK